MTREAPEPTTSLQNAQLKRLIRLRERRDRLREGVMLIEGARELARALGGGVQPGMVYIGPELFSADTHNLPLSTLPVTEPAWTVGCET